MSIFNRYIRILLLATLSATIGIFALKAFARTLDSAPPLAISLSDNNSYYYVADLNRQILYPRSIPHYGNQTNQYRRSPDGAYWFRTSYKSGEYILYIGEPPEEPQEIGRYDAIYHQFTLAQWAQDSSGVYLLREGDIEGETILFFVDRVTGDATDITTFRLTRRPTNLYYITEGFLFVSNPADSVIINMETLEQLALPTNQSALLWHGFNYDKPYILYREVDPDTDYPYGVSNTPATSFNVLDLRDYSISTVDLSQLPSAVHAGFPQQPIWIPQLDRFLFSMIDGGLALVRIPDGETEIVHPTMELYQSYFSRNSVWILGIIEGDTQDEAQLVAHHLETDEQVLLRSGEKYDLQNYDVSLSPIGDMAMITDIKLLASPKKKLLVTMIDIPSGEVIYDGSIIVDDFGRVGSSYYYPWYTARHPETFCILYGTQC